MAVKLPFRVKVCGVRHRFDIEACKRGGGDAVGLNFFPPSPRYVPLPLAAELAGVAREKGVLPIGLFVNESADRVLCVAEEIGLDWVQIHGDESPQDILSLKEHGLGVIRAVRLPRGPLRSEAIAERVQMWRDIGCVILLDADVGSAYGGAGEQLDWGAILAWGQPPFVLAGGLTVENVREAVVASGALAVDVSSGVEIVRGEKSTRLVESFCSAANDALKFNT